MKKVFLLSILLIGCGNKEAYVGTRDNDQNPVHQQSAQTVCVPLNQPSVMYRGFQCLRRHGADNCYNYQCNNGLWIQMNCQGQIL